MDLEILVPLLSLGLLGVMAYFDKREGYHSNVLLGVFLLVGTMYMFTRAFLATSLGNSKMALYILFSLFVSLLSVLLFWYAKSRFIPTLTAHDAAVVLGIALIYHYPLPITFGSSNSPAVPVIPPSIIAVTIALYLVSRDLPKNAVKIRLGRRTLPIIVVPARRYNSHLGLPVGVEGYPIIETYPLEGRSRQKRLLEIVHNAMEQGRRIYVIPYFPVIYYLFIGTLVAIPVSSAVSFATQLLLQHMPPIT